MKVRVMRIMAGPAHFNTLPRLQTTVAVVGLAAGAVVAAPATLAAPAIQDPAEIALRR